MALTRFYDGPLRWVNEVGRFFWPLFAPHWRYSCALGVAATIELVGGGDVLAVRDLVRLNAVPADLPGEIIVVSLQFATQHEATAVEAGFNRGD